MKVLLELARIAFIFGIFSSSLGSIVNFIYKKLGTDTHVYGWFGFAAIFILFLVLYRNRLQFSRWNPVKGREKFSKKVTNLLLSGSLFLIILPPLLSYLFQ
ncbi:hypothetical protein [Bacillus sp. FJAT-29814]|uniref:hypothetical protein n=1 Tax=Bacillus sp. FJAT-29814 TaxID=1729688 RepID=UPI00082B511B|nr:hypothetical protein [Bacillus sp. FJAT-29814]